MSQSPEETSPPSPPRGRGFQKIGNLTSPMSPTPSTTDGHQPESFSSPSGSETTGSPSRALMLVKQTGVELGRTGSRRLTSPIGTADRVKEVDQAVRDTLPRCLNLLLKPKYALREGETTRTLFLTFDLLDGMCDPGELEKAQQLAAWACKPAGNDDLLKALAILRSNTASRSPVEDAVAQARIYAKQLEDYPADIVLYVLTEWKERSSWWPTWKELMDEIKPLSKKRLALREALRKLADRVC